MSIDEYIQRQREAGEHRATGGFTIDLAASKSKLRFGLSSPKSALLKIVQWACRHDAPKIEIEQNQRQGLIAFRIRDFPSDGRPDKLAKSLGDTSSVSPELKFALLGCLSDEIQWVRWTVAVDKLFQSLELRRDGMITVTGELPGAKLGEALCLFEIGHDFGWKFWLGRSYCAGVFEILQKDCSFSPVDIRLNGEPLLLSSASILNSRVKFGEGSFNAATGVIKHNTLLQPASNLVFVLAQPGEAALRVATPPFSAYENHEKSLVLWKGRVAEGGLLEPDGDQIPALMMQFVKNRRTVALRGISPNPLCRAVIRMNIHGPGNSEPATVRVVRHGVLVSSSFNLPEANRQALLGCSILLADEELDTDLGGLGVVGNEKYFRKLAELEDIIEMGYAYFSAGEDCFARLSPDERK